MNKKKQYDIIHIRDYYPSKENPASSPWVYDIVKGIQKKEISCLVISPTPYIPGFIRKQSKYYLYPTPSNKIENYKSTDVIRPLYIKIPKNYLLSINFYLLTHLIAKTLPKNINPKIIHAHFGQNGIASIKLKQKCKIPLVTSFYGYDAGRLGKKFKPYYKKLIKYGDLFLVLSEDMKSDLLDLGFPENKIIIHHLGIDLDQFTPQKREQNGFVYLVVARLDESKGVQDTIKAFSIICQHDMQLRIVGDGVYKDELVALVKKLNLEHQVIFINNFKADNPRQMVVDEMQNCDVALLTSFVASNGAKEGTPVVLMEAQACGKPCISTNHAGIPEVVINNKTGFIVEERNVKDISIKMLGLFNNVELRKQMGHNALMHIKKEFNQNIQLIELIKLYGKL